MVVFPNIKKAARFVDAPFNPRFMFVSQQNVSFLFTRPFPAYIAQLVTGAGLIQKCAILPGLDHVHTTNEPYQSLFVTGPRTFLQTGLSLVVWSAEFNYCVQTNCTKGEDEPEFKSTSIFLVHFLSTCLFKQLEACLGH